MTDTLTKKWNPAYDAREHIRAAASSRVSRGVDRETVDAVLDSLFYLVYGDLKTTIVGLAKFEWKPLRTKLPDGTPVTTRRLVVTPSRYHATPAKDRPVMGKPGVPGREGR